MPIPESPRVKYQKDCLSEVICQLRFSPILKIATEMPAEFQDKIRHQYPRYMINAPKPTIDLPQEVIDVLTSVQPMKLSQIHSFVSPCKKLKLSLSHFFIALSTQEYCGWEDFRERLLFAINVLSSIYKPNLFLRIGLRYRNVIGRSTLGLQDFPWVALLQPHIAGELTNTLLCEDIKDIRKEALFDLGSTNAAAMRHGFADVNEERCYFIDVDYYNESEMEYDNVITTLDDLNKFAGRLFRSCITKQLHDAMDPKPI